MDLEQTRNSECRLGNSKRRQQRQCIVECLYMWEMQQDVAIEQLFEDYCMEKQDDGLKEACEADFVIDSLRGTINHHDVIDATIKKYAKNWAFDRIAKINLSILRLAIYELKFCPSTPVPIVINEAIELSKIYSSDDSKRFINGILDHVAKQTA